MTAQMMEKLIYRGEKYSMAACPLDDYFDSINFKPHYKEPHTACWRGYVCTWEIKDDKLYLIDMHIFHPSEIDGMLRYFPGQEEVLANWFTGNIRIPLGRLINYEHGGFASTFEQDYIFTFDKGAITKKVLKDNRDCFAKNYYYRNDDDVPF